MNWNWNGCGGLTWRAGVGYGQPHESLVYSCSLDWSGGGGVPVPVAENARWCIVREKGGVYESPSGKAADWRKLRAKDQLEVAQAAFDKKDYKLAMKAALRVVTVWPLSDYAPQGQYLVGRCYEQRRMDEKAFKAYDQLLSKYPKMTTADEIQGHQFEIAGRFLAGEWIKLFGYIPFFPSMDKAAEMYGDIVRFGAYGPYGPEAQMNIGAAREKQKDYQSAVQAYEVAADRYSVRPAIAATALYKAALAWNKQARKADYEPKR